ncbi:MAG: tripartite tricarboxylate transporter substrate binding protein [Burkholderiales bacterium]|nr:tripartite tricarboxylate transporter substrate binding protein [Burkholderiales bacterium]
MAVNAFVLALAALPAAAQPAAGGYPTKPVRFICPFPPGGLNDLLARFFAQRLTETLGQQVFVDNRGGAAGIIGAEAGMRAAPDGYTITMANLSMMTINPSLYAKLPYDSLRDFAHVIELAESVNLLLVHPSLPVRSVKQLIALAKTRPGEINFGSPGIGTPGHLATELMSTMAGIKMHHVPYKGSGAGIPALIGGETQVYIEPVATIIQHVTSGRVRALAVTSAQRAAMLPDLPTVADTLAGFEFTSWYGVLMPAATPRPLVLRVNEAINRVLAQAEVKEYLAKQAMVPLGGAPEAFTARIKRESARWGKVVKDTGARAE